MNDEIKEILDGMKKANNENCNLWLENVSVKLLYNYITNLQNKYENQIHRYMNLKEQTTNLQEENERLKERCDYLQRSCDRKEEQRDDARMEYMEQEDYKSRCEKANEYLPEVRKASSYELDEKIDNLESILNGGDNQ